MIIKLLIKILSMFGRIVNFSNCYFCSTPLKHSEINIFITDRKFRVICCKTCYLKIKSSKMAKVLCFSDKKGKIRHWSHNPYYTPSDKNKNLNSGLTIIKDE